MTDVLRPLRNSISAKILYSDNVSLSKVLNTKIMIDIIIGVLGFSRGPLLSSVTLAGDLPLPPIVQLCTPRDRKFPEPITSPRGSPDHTLES